MAGDTFINGLMGEVEFEMRGRKYVVNVGEGYMPHFHKYMLKMAGELHGQVQGRDIYLRSKKQRYAK